MQQHEHSCAVIRCMSHCSLLVSPGDNLLPSSPGWLFGVEDVFFVFFVGQFFSQKLPPKGVNIKIGETRCGFLDEFRLS